MALREILLYPDPRLRKVCAPVGTVDDRVRALMDDMLQTMYEAPGIGLAAPQVGVLKRVFVMDCAGGDDDPAPLCLADPQILWTSEEINLHEEGCLSIPEHFGEVGRPDRVRIRFLNRDGVAEEREFDGLGATCVQHEMDHLNGRLFIDYLGPVKRALITGKMKKLKKQKALEAAKA